MTDIRCFLLVPVDGVCKRYLRRYGGSCSGAYPYHNAEVEIERGAARAGSDLLDPQHPLRADPRWPTRCSCGHVFRDDVEPWQLFVQQVYRRADSGEEMTLREAPPGAMWFATWYEDEPAYCGPDSRSLIVKTPGGDWMVDSRAKNCTSPQDHEHKCWVRHGVPPNITVDKNGKTCTAGAGSIAQQSYHGFLRNGYLVPA